MLVLRGEFGLAKKPRSTSGCPSVNHESFGLGGHLVKTDFFVNNESEGGLQEQHVKKAKKILKEEA